MPPAKPKKQRVLLATMTKEPFQPVRLYYRIPSRPAVLAALRRLECTVEVAAERCWQWVYCGEAASIRFAYAGYDDVPEAARPIVLGRIRFPKKGGMMLQVHSVERAVEGAKFFASHLGPGVVPVRCRLVNRLFAANEGKPAELARHLDRNVTVIDPRAAEARMEEELKDVRSMDDLERAAGERMKRRIESGDDVPPVEDFPLVPEEETPELRDLTAVLSIRLVRAYEHWAGNTYLTLPAIIDRLVREHMGV